MKRILLISAFLSILSLLVVDIISLIYQFIAINGQKGFNIQIGYPFAYFNEGDSFYKQSHHTYFLIPRFIGNFLVYAILIAPITYLYSKILKISEINKSSIIKIISLTTILTIFIMGSIYVAQSYKNKELSANCYLSRGIPYSKGYNHQLSCDTFIGFPFVFAVHHMGSSLGMYTPPSTNYKYLSFIGDFLFFFISIFSINSLILWIRSRKIKKLPNNI